MPEPSSADPGSPAPVPVELAERLRRPAPTGCSVVPASLAFVSFGDPTMARVLTLSTNPGKLELTTPRGVWLPTQHRRVESLRSLDVQSPAELTDAQLATVLQRAHGYFTGADANPHRPRFAALTEVLGAIGAGSYHDGSAAHLDVVQWATNPVWSGLTPAVREQLADADAGFLRWQLRRSGAAVVLVDGAHVAPWLERAGIVRRFTADEVTYRNSRGNDRTMRLARAEAGGHLVLALEVPAGDALSPDGTARRAQWLTEQVQPRLG